MTQRMPQTRNGVSLAFKPGRKSRQTGLTLIELMISLVLGLIVISAVINVYVGSTRSATFSDGLRAMQENGRHGISALQRGIRLAGYTPFPNEQFDAFDIPATDQESLVIRSRETYDCNGQPTAANDGMAVNTYRWVPAERQIICRGSSAAATDMPLVDGVDGFRVLYGIDADGDNFSEIYIPYSNAIDSREINTIRFALLVSSDGPIRSRNVEETHTLFDEEYESNDRVSRRVFTTTVMLRNRR